MELYSGDRLEPALALIEHGNLDYISFECLAERTIALAQKEKKNNPQKGYNHLLEYRMEQVLPLAYKNKVKVITNMRAANPISAMNVICELAKKEGVRGVKVAAVLGDDVFDFVKKHPSLQISETGDPLSTIEDKIISANAYLGSEGIVQALKNDADFIITGRVADPSLFLAPMIHEFNWNIKDYDKLGKGTLVGHLLECAGQVSGGYFADPNKKKVPDLWDIGFPFVEIDEMGSGYITKVDGTGGMINTATCTEQLLYEIHDPANYLTPDCIADFSSVKFKPTEKDVVKFRNATGKEATETYKVSVGYLNGYYGEGQISYGGIQCIERAKLGIAIVQKRLEKLNFKDLRFDLIGLNSISPLKEQHKDVNEVRLRVSGRAKSIEEAKKIVREVETLYTNGPSGGGGATQKVEEVISVVSVLVPKSEVKTQVVYSKT